MHLLRLARSYSCFFLFFLFTRCFNSIDRCRRFIRSFNSECAFSFSPGSLSVFLSFLTVYALARPIRPVIHYDSIRFESITITRGHRGRIVSRDSTTTDALRSVAGEQAGLLGFYDPCYGRRKTLRVEYSFRGELHRASVEDTGGLVAPLRGACVRVEGAETSCFHLVHLLLTVHTGHLVI